MVSDNCFSKSKRLLTPAVYKAVFDKADYKVSRRELLCLAKENSLNHPRLGLVIAKKNIRLAVERNRIKRLIRDSFRLHQHQLPAVDIVLLARKGLGDKNNADIHKELAKTWQTLIKKQAEKV